MKLSSIGKIVAEEWRMTASIRPRVGIDEFVVMPNHMHGIIVIGKSNRDDSLNQVPFADVDETHSSASENKPVETHSSASLQNGGDEHLTNNPSSKIFGPQRNNLASIIRGFKSACTKRIHAAGYVDFAWQPRYYDRIIRDESELDRIREYIISNPINWNSDEYYQ